MLNSTLPVAHNPLHSLVSRLSLIGTISAIGLLSGWVPGLSRDFSTLAFNTATYAQSAEQVTQYAKAVLQIEPVRQEALAEAKQLMGGNVPSNVCRQSSVPNAVDSVCKTFLSRSAEIIKSSGLTIGGFNQMTMRLQKDSGLRDRMRQELIRQQQ